MESFIKPQSLDPDNVDAEMSFNVAYDFETIDSSIELTLSLLFDEELGELIKRTQ